MIEGSWSFRALPVELAVDDLGGIYVCPTCGSAP